MDSAFNLDRQNSNLNSRIVAALGRISEAFRALLWQAARTFSLTPIQIQILIFLATHKKALHTVTHLSREFNLTKPTISDAIKSLGQKSLVTKKLNQQDEREYFLSLTRRGKKIATIVSLLTQEIEKTLLSFSEDNNTIVLLTLLKIIEHLNKAGIISIQRMCLTCIYYVTSYNGEKHYCKLLEKKLEAAELRLDCPEHLDVRYQ